MGTGTDPDRQALDSDLDPVLPKWYPSDRIRIHSTDVLGPVSYTGYTALPLNKLLYHIKLLRRIDFLILFFFVYAGIWLLSSLPVGRWSALCAGTWRRTLRSPTWAPSARSRTNSHTWRTSRAATQPRWPGIFLPISSTLRIRIRIQSGSAGCLKHSHTLHFKLWKYSWQYSCWSANL